MNPRCGGNQSALQFIVVEKEAAENKEAIRKPGAGDQGVFGLDKFAVKFAEEVAVPV